MARKRQGQEPRPEDNGRGLLSEDYSEIRLIPAKDRDWWQRLDRPARARFAANRRKKWSDEETERLILADPDKDDYYSLAAELGRSPGSLRIRRSHMIHLLRDDYGYVAKAKAYLEDPKEFHKFADMAQVYTVLESLGFTGLPVHEQFAMARHLKQPSSGWRGDRSEEVFREQRKRAEAIRARIDEIRNARR